MKIQIDPSNREYKSCLWIALYAITIITALFALAAHLL